MKRITAILGYYLFICLVVLASFGAMHEETHKEIFKHYGINSKIDYIHYFPDLVTIPDKPCPNEYCELSQNFTESIGYVLIIVLAGVMLAGFVIVIVLCLILEELDGSRTEERA